MYKSLFTPKIDGSEILIGYSVIVSTDSGIPVVSQQTVNNPLSSPFSPHSPHYFLLTMKFAIALTSLLAGLSGSHAQQPNHVCSGSVELPLGGSTGGTTLDAILSSDQCTDPGVSVSATQKAWFNITSTDKWLSLHLCPNNNIVGAEWDVKIQQAECGFSGSCLLPVEGVVDENDFPACPRGATTTTIAPFRGIDFLAFVTSGTSPASAGSFVLTYVDHAPPANSVCTSALPLSTDAAPLESSFANAVDDTVACEPAGKVVWFSFMGTGEPLYFRACSATAEADRVEVRVQATSSCAEGQACFCDPTSDCGREFIDTAECPRGNQQLIQTVAGVTYYGYAKRDFYSTDAPVFMTVTTTDTGTASASPTMLPASTPMPAGPTETSAPTGMPSTVDEPSSPPSGATSRAIATSTAATLAGAIVMSTIAIAL